MKPTLKKIYEPDEDKVHYEPPLGILCGLTDWCESTKGYHTNKNVAFSNPTINPAYSASLQVACGNTLYTSNFSFSVDNTAAPTLKPGLPLLPPSKLKYYSSSCNGQSCLIVCTSLIQKW